jgi:hypothetical protein
MRQAERAVYLVELKSELKDIKEANVGDIGGFLRHIYATYPPKNPNHKLDEKKLEDCAMKKKVLLTAIQHYHPDKQDSEQYGKKWSVLCEEITKLFNGRYEDMKG